MENAQTVNSNEQTASIAEPIEKGGGESISFDDLELMHDASKPLARNGDVKARNQKEKEKSDHGDSEVGKPQQTKEAKNGQEEKSEKGKSEKELLDEKTLADNKLAARVLKYKAGESEADIPEDAMFTVKVNGETVTVPLKDLMGNYSGKTAWDKKFSELDREKKSFEGQRSTVQNSIKLIKELADSGDPRSAIEKICELTGADPVKTWNDLSGTLYQKFNELSNLSPEERQFKEAQEKADYLQKKVERYTQQEKEAQELTSLEEAIEKQITENKLDGDTFWRRYDELKAKGIDPKEIKPEVVVKYHKEISLLENSANLTFDIFPLSKDGQDPLSPENRNEIYGTIRDIWKTNPDYKYEDILTVAKKVYSDTEAKNLSKKIKRAEPVNTVKVPKSRKDDPVGFDDLED